MNFRTLSAFVPFFTTEKSQIQDIVMNPFLVSSESKNQIKSIVEQLIEDDFYSKIIKSVAFKRLKNISFLGAIDYAWPCSHLKRAYRTRHDHSLWVAALAIHVSRKRNYCKDIERHLVSAALLHDIGHAPLSHSMEPAFKAKWGLGHHEFSNKIIRGEEEIGKDLSSTLKKFLNVPTVLDLIEGKGETELAELFNSPINIDTIDGIIRSYNYTRKRGTSLNPIKVCEAAFLDRKEDSETILDEFWRLKDFVYKEFILSKVGIKADLLSQNYFSKKEKHFSISDLFETEKIWSERHFSLFDDLKRASENLDRLDLFNANIQITRRSYFVNYNIKLGTFDSYKKRYECKKFKENYAIRNERNDFFFQHSFSF